MVKLYFTHGRGLCQFAKTEIECLVSELKKKDVSISLTINDYIEGKLSFETNLNFEKFLNLTTIERLFYQLIFKKFDITPLEDELIQIIENEFILTSDDEFFIQKLIQKVSDEHLESVKKARKSITFRIDSKLTGKWKHNSKLKYKLNELISQKLQNLNFCQDLSRPDFILSCHLSQVSLIIGIPLSKTTVSSRESIKNIGLRSTICSAMIQLSDIKNQSNSLLIFDPFCGKSTILSELLLQYKLKHKLFYVSSDIDQTQIDLSVENFENLYSQNILVDFLLVNLSKNSQFPFRNGIFDCILTDLPFGKNHPIKHFNDLESFYSKIITEFNRLLYSGMCVVLINSNDAKNFEDLLSRIETDLKLVSKHPISLGETNAVIFKLKKKSEFKLK